MNSGFRRIPPSMPVDRAAELMVRRGEARNFHAARAAILKQRTHSRGDYGRTEITQSDRDARARVESPPHYRLPYADND